METIFYTIQEVAEILSLSEQTIRKLVHEGRLNAICLGRTYRIPYESLIELRSTHNRSQPRMSGPWRNLLFLVNYLLFKDT